MHFKEWLESTGRSLKQVDRDTLLVMQEYLDFNEGKSQKSLFNNVFEYKIESKDLFKKELSIMVNSDIEKAELKELQKELKKDEEDGLLLIGEPFYIEDNKLFIDRYKIEIATNLKGLAKSIINEKYKQKIDLDNVFYLKEDFIGNDVYKDIYCINSYGVRFQVQLDDILDKLKKIPFE